MKRVLTVVALTAILSLSACGAVDKIGTSWTGSSERCYRNVLYVNFTTGASPVYRSGPNGEPLLTAC